MSSRTLWPREHGAYVQLAVPLLVALAMRPPAAAAIAFAVAACAAFLSYEPLLVLRGLRGRRMQQELRVRAQHRLAMLLAAAAAAGGFALATASRDAVAMAGVVAVAATITLALAWRRAAHTLPGEIAAAVALSGAGAPVMVASGASWQAAAVVWAAWSLGYACTVVAVHRVLDAVKRTRSGGDLAIAAALAIIACTAFVAAPRIPAALASAALAAAAAVVAFRLPSPRRLRVIGVAMTLVSVAAGTTLVALW
jgi:hypothetical protein